MRNYPKIIFNYSWIYDQIYKENWELKKKKIKPYPSAKKILNYIKKIEKLWKKEEKRVMQEIAKIIELKWKLKSIECYVVGRCRPISCPLTMPVYEKRPTFFIDVLVHELIHTIFTGNDKNTKKAWRYIESKHKKESWTTKNHIVIHAIHSHIYFKFYGEKRLMRDIGSMSWNPDYKKAWDIVKKEGYKNIVNEFAKRIKNFKE